MHLMISEPLYVTRQTGLIASAHTELGRLSSESIAYLHQRRFRTPGRPLQSISLGMSAAAPNSLPTALRMRCRYRYGFSCTISINGFASTLWLSTFERGHN